MSGFYGSAGGILRAGSEGCRNCSRWCTYELNPPKSCYILPKNNLGHAVIAWYRFVRRLGWVPQAKPAGFNARLY